MRCERCPVDEGNVCLGDTGRMPVFCRWAESGDPVQVAHVVARSAMPAPGEPRPFPPLAEQAANLAGSVARFVASGMERATPEEVARRVGICEGCPEMSGGRCRLCGCRLRYKQAMATELCPIDKW